MDKPIAVAPLPLESVHGMARIALYAALVGAGAFIHVPVGPMFISLQTMMIMLAGFALGPKKAALAMLLYLLCGLIGLPMFGQGKAGPASLLGPTAGYFPGFVLGAVLAGCSVFFARGSRTGRMAARLVLGALGSVALLLTGAALLRLRFIPDWNSALLVGFFPFIVGDLIKMTAAAFVAEAFFPKTGEDADGR
ncbi:MAG: biotin transporter BioY [Planctomycetota bacterium]|jgi:biotin transport system substrate-specific component|nr:biotin transporter BioY [Planctomycetota bacterium]